MNLINSLSTRLRHHIKALFAQLNEPAWTFSNRPWPDNAGAAARAPAQCNICGWCGDAFPGRIHSEGATCPQCGSISRDRFLFYCFITRTAPKAGMRVLETSPRMNQEYRRAMASWFDYTASDYDERAHKGMLKLDLQAIDLPDASFDIILSAHVLEHVPETDRAIAELHRILRVGGRLYLQVPLLQGITAPPESPEFHGDNTPVYWRFGFDLTYRLRRHGFTTRLLTTDEFLGAVIQGLDTWPSAPSPEFDVTAMLKHAIHTDLTSCANQVVSQQHSFLPAYMYFTWECIKTAGNAS